MQRLIGILVLIALAAFLGMPTAAARNYALLICAGETTADDAEMNCEWWYDLLLTYEMLIDNHYAPDDICVLYGDGTDFMSVHERYQNPYPHSITNYDNHMATIESVIDSLSSVLTSGDNLYIWWTGHGTLELGHLQLIIENTGERILDEEFADWMEAIDEYNVRFFSVMTCRSGGIIDDLEGERTVVMTSCAFTEPSMARWICEARHSEFRYAEAAAWHWQTPFQYCGLVDADEDDDYKVSYEECFHYAQEGTHTSTPQLSDLGGRAPNHFLTKIRVDCVAETIDDDALGSSQGNGNAQIENAETIELTVTLANLSAEDYLDVSGELVCNDPYITLIVPEGYFGDIHGGSGTASNTVPFVFAVSTDIPDGHILMLTLALENAPEDVELSFPAHAPELSVLATNIDDSIGGDGDGIAEPGEMIDLSLVSTNTGSVPIEDAGVVLAGDPYLMPEASLLALQRLEPGEEKVTESIALVIDPATPAPYFGSLTALFRGPADYRRTALIIFSVGEVYTDDMEEGTAWQHYSGTTGYGDEWYLSTYRNHTYGGAQCYKCGGPVAGYYGNMLHAILESDPFVLPEGASLCFWHWIDAEISLSHYGYCYDGGLIEISAGGGPWEVVTPVGGYSHLIRTGSTAGPFPADTPVFSGEHDWEPVTMDLSGYSGEVSVRFAFGSDGGVTGQGWFIDDVGLTMAPFSGLVDPARNAVIRLHPARPNPAAGMTQVRLDLPAAMATDVRIFDAAGRMVRTLHDGLLPAGEHVFSWDGRTARGARAGAGVYWIRATQGHQQKVVRLVRAE